MGRGLSKLQKTILVAATNGGVQVSEARNILFEMLPAKKRLMPVTRSRVTTRRVGVRITYLANGRQQGNVERVLIKPRIFTPSERRDNAIASSVIRAINRLVKRDLLEKSENRVHEVVRVLTKQGNLTVKNCARPACVNAGNRRKREHTLTGE